MEEKTWGMRLFFIGLVLLMASNYGPIVDALGITPIKGIISFIGVVLFVCGILLYRFFGK